MMWDAFITHVLDVRLKQLESNIRRAQREGEDLRNSHSVRLYVCAYRGINHARQDPTTAEFVQGNTLGPQNRDWRRIKKLLPVRYRLFFKFFSSHHEIFFAWMNDEKTLRKEGAKSDCYAYFKRLLEGGAMPSDRDSLAKLSAPINDENK